MSQLQTRTQSVAGQVQKRRSAATDVQTRHGQCLVVSGSRDRREMFNRASSQAGWDTVVCADQQNALAAVRRTRFQLALVDLDHYGDTPAGFRDLAQTLSTTPGMLLVICGRELQPDEEIWARQLGVWLYLPGVSLQHGDELAELCQAAQQVVEL